jgi:hypothetical protein
MRAIVNVVAQGLRNMCRASGAHAIGRSVPSPCGLD